MKAIRLIGIVLLAAAFSGPAVCQEDTIRTVRPFVQGGIYDKPFITRLGGKTTIGGYTDLVGGFVREAGINEGWSFEARRFNLFTYSVLADGITVTSEIEIEHGGEEFKLEYGLLDIEFHEALNLRGGVILSPLGKTNLVHDSPKLELVERPLMSTELIPTTLSEVGAGFFGAFYPGDVSRLTYEIYATNGFHQGLIEAGPGTRLARGKGGLFEEDNNGEPAAVGRVAFSPEFGSEVGVSFHTGAYNVFRVEGLEIDARRSLTILAADAEYAGSGFNLQAEYARAHIQIPGPLHGLFAQKQHGMFVQINLPFAYGLIDRWPRSKLTASVRYDIVDFDLDLPGDDHQRITLGLNLRLIQDAVLKINYEQNWVSDRENNVTRGVRFLISFASYF